MNNFYVVKKTAFDVDNEFLSGIGISFHGFNLLYFL